MKKISFLLIFNLLFISNCIYAKEIKKRVDAGIDAYPDYITLDSGSGGSATAPLEMMERVYFFPFT